MDARDTLDDRQQYQRTGDDPEPVRVLDQQEHRDRYEDEDLEIADEPRQGGRRVRRRDRGHREAHHRQAQDQCGGGAQRASAQIQQPPHAQEHRDPRGQIGRSDRRAAAPAA